MNLGATASNVRLYGSLGSALAEWDLGSGSGKLFNRNGTVTINLGSLTGGANTQLLGAGSVDAASTYSIGALGGDMTFAGSIKDGTAGANAKTGVTKTGGGILTLTGANTYTDSTTISAGSLAVEGSLAATATTIASGATLRGTGTLGGAVTAQAGGKISPGSTTGSFGTLHLGAGLTLQGATLSCTLSGNPVGTNDLILLTGGALSMTGTNTISLSLTDRFLGAGTYTVLSGGSGTTGSVANLSASFPTGTRQSYGLAAPAGQIQIVVTGSPASLNWTGANGGVWDLNTTANNWLLGAASANFYNLDTVNFTDSSAVGTINLTGTLTPLLIAVANAATAYTFTGSGVLGGAASLVKNGADTLTIGGTGVHVFTGNTTLNSGTLALDTAVATPLGTGVVNVNGGTLHLGVARSVPNSVFFSGTSAVASTSGNVNLVSNTANTLSSTANAVMNFSIPSNLCTIQGPMDGFLGTINMGASNGTLRLNGNLNATYGSPTAAFDLGTASATLCNRNGDIVIDLGAVSGGANTTLQGRQSGSRTTSTSTYYIGGRNTDDAFAGHITSGGDLSGLNIIKVGTGTWTLSGTSSYTGTLTAQQGRIMLSGPLACSGTAQVLAGATFQLGSTLTTEEMIVAYDGQLTGTGTVAGDLTNNGTVSCTGPLTVTGNITNNATLRLTGGAALSASRPALWRRAPSSTTARSTSSPARKRSSRTS